MKPEVLIYNKEKIMANKKITKHVEKISEKVREKLTAYLNAWINMDWVKMLAKSTLTFKSMNSPSYFDNWMGKTQLLSFVIIEVKGKKATPAMCDVVVRVEVSFEGNAEIREYPVRLVQELEPYRASINGVWGVNPPSSLRFLNPGHSYKVTTNGENKKKENKDA